MPKALVRTLRLHVWPAAVVALAGLASPAAADPQRAASSGSAFVVIDESSQVWIIGNELISLVLGRSESNSAALLAIRSSGAGAQDVVAAVPRSARPLRSAQPLPQRIAARNRLQSVTAGTTAFDQDLEVPAVSQASFMAGAVRLNPGQGSLPLKEARATEADGAVHLVLTFEDAEHGLRVTRVYACYPGAPGIETWSTFEAPGASEPLTLSDIGLWKFTIPASDVNWVTGLKASAAEGGQFTLKRQALETDGWFEIESSGRSSETAVPVAWLTGEQGQLFAGMMWSGAWSLSVSGPGPDGLAIIRLSLGSVATGLEAGRRFETPHAFFGLAGTGPSDIAAALQAFARHDVRRGRPLRPLVTYNTWYAYGIGITEERVKEEMNRAAALGVEAFVVDAGWYAGGTQLSDFSTGIGAWTADARRFPSGLRALSDHAHALGMKFGLWIEPERTDTHVVNRAGFVRETWLATTGGRYNPGVSNTSAGSAQICLAGAGARQWVADQLERLVSEARLDYLKWDNNYWINCDRPGHDHGAKDGNLAHVQGLYDILGQLRQRHPDLIIENCAEGGHRLDLGMLRLTDVAWMDDESAPSPYVRHNLEGLSAIFPPEYLLSFVMNHPAEPLHGSADMAYAFRSRMPGALGMSLIGAEFDEGDHRQMRDEVALSKRVRSMVPQPRALLLTEQADTRGGSGWDAIELLAPEPGRAVIFTYTSAGAGAWMTVKPQGLAPERRYVIRSLDGTILAEATGTELMADGVQLARDTESAANVLIIEAGDAPPPLRH
jgi:alpha-galactosidase